MTANIHQQVNHIVELKGRATRLDNLIQGYRLCARTDDKERIRLTNGRDHTFRVYRGSRGLTRPHKIATDFISGDKYVDLAEPED